MLSFHWVQFDRKLATEVAAMQLTYTILGLMLAAFASGQLFDRPVLQFGFDFPGFAEPEAFEEVDPPFMGLSGIRERMAELSKGQMKKRPGVKTKVKTRHEGLLVNSFHANLCFLAYKASP